MILLFKKVRQKIYILNPFGTNLTSVPSFVLGIYPRAQCSDDQFTEKEIKDFEKEILRTQKLFNQIPKPNRDRPLDEVARYLTSDQRLKFLYQGNELLVSVYSHLFNFNY